MAGMKFALVCALVTLMAVAYASQLDMALDVSDRELVTMSSSSLIEMDSALEAVRAMDQDMSLIDASQEVERRRRRGGRRRGKGRKIHRRRGRKGRKIRRRGRKGRKIRRRRGRKGRKGRKIRRRGRKGRKIRRRGRKGRKIRRRGRKGRKIRRRGRKGRKGRKIRRRRGRKGRKIRRRRGRKGRKIRRRRGRKGRKIRRRRGRRLSIAVLRARYRAAKKLAKGLRRQLRKKGSASLRARANKAARRANRLLKILRVRKQRRRNAKRRALKRAARKAKRKSRKLRRKMRKLAKRAKRAKRGNSIARRRAQKKKLRKLARIQALKALVNTVPGDNHLSPAAAPVVNEMMASVTKLQKLVSRPGAEKIVQDLETQLKTIIDLEAVTRNEERAAQKRNLRVQRITAKIAQKRAKIKDMQTKGVVQAAVDLEKKELRKLKDKLKAQEEKAKKEKELADKNAAANKEKIEAANKRRLALINEVKANVNADGQVELDSLLKKYERTQTVLKAEIKAASAVSMAAPPVTRQDLIKNDPKGKFKALDPKGVTANEAVTRIARLHEENKYRDFSTLKMDNELGTVAEIRQKPIV